MASFDIDYNIKSNHDDNLDTYDIIITTLFGLIFVAGIIGNGIVVYLFKTKDKRSIMEDLIIYLAIVDFFVSVFSPLLFIYWTVTFEQAWHFGYVGCKVLPAFSRIGITISIGIILIMAIERCRVLSQPFKANFTRPHIYIALLITFILSLATEVPFTIYEDVIKNSTCSLPRHVATEMAISGLCIYSIRDISCIAVFMVTFYLIYKELYDKERSKTLVNQKSIMKKKKVFIMLVTMAIVFVILMFPRDLYHISFVLSWASSPGIPVNNSTIDVNTFLKMLQTSNSVANVFIYARLHGSFRRRLFHSFSTKKNTREEEQRSSFKKLEDLEQLYGCKSNTGDIPLTEHNC